MKKKMRVLKEVDDLILEKLNKVKQKAEEIGMIDTINEKLCKQCLEGKLKEVKPLIEMGELTLHECLLCGEREYV